MQSENKVHIPDAWIGIDVAKNTFDAAIHLPVEYGQPAREITEIPSFSYYRTKQGLQEMFSKAKSECEKFASKRGVENPSLRIVMEATGRYSIELASWINETAPETKPVIDDPSAIYDYTKSLKIRNKTDAVDAAALAKYGAERMPEPQSEMPSHYAELRERTRLRENLVNELTAVRERYNETRNSSTCAEIQKKLIQHLKKSLEEIDEAIRQQVENYSDLKRAVELIETIPGAGFLTAVVVLSECGPMENFTRSRSLGSYAGLSPKRQESGTSVKGKSHITRRGPKVLRQKLYMASIVAGNKINSMQNLKKRMVEKGKAPMSARCAIMRKLLILIRAVVINDTPFIHDYNIKKNSWKNNLT